MLSRVLGFVRDQMLGPLSALGDFGCLACRLSPAQLFRRTFADGAMSMAFVPMFKARLESDEAARAFANGGLYPDVVDPDPADYHPDSRHAWVMDVLVDFERGSKAMSWWFVFGRIMIPYLLLMTLLALIGAMLDSLGRFGPGPLRPLC